MDKKEMPFEVGKSYFIRTVTYHVLGMVKKITGDFLELDHASWIADSGRFGEAITKGVLSEVEYVGTAIVNTNAVTDAYLWVHDLPDKTK